jgi:hypothetical protein
MIMKVDEYVSGACLGLLIGVKAGVVSTLQVAIKMARLEPTASCSAPMVRN